MSLLLSVEWLMRQKLFSFPWVMLPNTNGCVLITTSTLSEVQRLRALRDPQPIKRRVQFCNFDTSWQWQCPNLRCSKSQLVFFAFLIGREVCCLIFLALRLTFDVTLSRLCKGRSDDYGENGRCWFSDDDVMVRMIKMIIMIMVIMSFKYYFRILSAKGVTPTVRTFFRLKKLRAWGYPPNLRTVRQIDPKRISSPVLERLP